MDTGTVALISAAIPLYAGVVAVVVCKIYFYHKLQYHKRVAGVVFQDAAKQQASWQ